MLISIVNDYTHAILIDKFRGDWKSKLFLVSSLFVNLGLLFYFKYFNFFIDNINFFFESGIEIKEVLLPIGISFYTFQTMSYTIDVFLGNVKVQKNILTLATYVALFPQLIAGPIVRYSTVEKDLTFRQEDTTKVADGLRRFILGLGKKVLIANQIALAADAIFSQSADDITMIMAWFGSFAYALQIFFDFSGYSDMAIGLGKVFGFTFLENFNYPYLSKSITEFWRRWHMSLGSWFRDYVYIPLGGNQKGLLRWLVNVSIVWIITGFWHGAEWNFILWGVYFGVLLVFEKAFLLNTLMKVPGLNHIVTIALLLVGWVIFRSPSLDYMTIYLKAMFDLSNIGDLKFMITLNIRYLWPYFIAGIILCFPLLKNLFTVMNRKFLSGVIYDIIIFVIFILSVMYLITSTHNPFIYFRF